MSRRKKNWPKEVPLPDPGVIIRIVSRARIDGDVQDDCWLWTGATHRNGHGQIRWRGRTWWVHRIMCALRVGPIARGLDVHHTCYTPTCVNPAHLTPRHPAKNRADSRPGRDKKRSQSPDATPF